MSTSKPLTPKMKSALAKLKKLTTNTTIWFRPRTLKSTPSCLLALVERGLVSAEVFYGIYVFKLKRVSQPPREEHVAGSLAISTNGKGEVTLGFNVHEMTVDTKGDGHIVMSLKQCRNLCYLLAKNIRIATTQH